MMEHSIEEMEKDCGLDRNAALADMRYTFIEKYVIRRSRNVMRVRNISEV